MIEFPYCYTHSDSYIDPWAAWKLNHQRCLWAEKTFGHDRVCWIWPDKTPELELKMYFKDKADMLQYVLTHG